MAAVVAAVGRDAMGIGFGFLILSFGLILLGAVLLFGSAAQRP